jgi:tetratricopeptide (TPR) repeat protein
MTSFNSSNDPSSTLTFEYENFTETSISDNTSNPIMTPFNYSDHSPSTLASDFGETPIPENVSNVPDNFDMMIDVARSFMDRGLMSEAVQCLETALSTAMDTLGREHPTSLEIMNSLGRAYGDQRRLEDAAELLQETLEKRRGLLGWDDVKTLETASNLAWTLVEQGDVAKQEAYCMEQQGFLIETRIIQERSRALMVQAEHLREAIYDARLRILGSEHYNTIQSAADLAWIYGKQGHTTKAIDIFITISPKIEEHLGENHANTLWTIKSLATLYQEAGRFMDAEVYYKKLLERIESFGVKDRRVIAIQQNIGRIYALQGRMDEVIELLENLMQRMRLEMNDEDPRIFGTINNLASLYFDKGDIMKALSLHENLYIMRTKILGEDHIDTIRSRCWIHHIQQTLEMR